MIKQSECIGLPVISFEKGNFLGRVKDIIFLLKTKNIFGFLLEDSPYGLKKKLF